MRADSWADEVERAVSENRGDREMDEDDRNQWLNGKRIPSNWATGQAGQVREAAEMSGQKQVEERKGQKQ